MSGNAFTRTLLAMTLCMGVGVGCGGLEEETPREHQAPAEAPGTTEAAVLAANFCGPHTRTYLVEETLTRKVVGIRCVKVVNNHSFAWYGEGRWGNATYRHVGYAASDNFNGGVRFWGSLADIYGNGESYQGFYNQNLNILASSPIDGIPGADTITIQSPFGETWYRASASDTRQYEPLPFEMSRCGNPNLNQMKVIKNGVASNDVRCLLDLKAGVNLPYAWVGKGTFGSLPYLHLGTGNFQLGGGWGASDLCLTPNHACNTTPFGYMSLSLLANSNIWVSGAWNETWYP